MQIIRRYLAGIIVVVCLLSSVFSMQSRQVAVYLPMQENTEMEKRACWISYIDMESELSDKSEAAFRAKVHAMYDTVKRYGLNTVIVHARAMGDAFYPSDYFPYSEYMSKSRTYPGYDPYEIMVAVAHEEGLRFEAWINPYRLSLGEETTASFEHTPFYAKYQSMILEYQGQNGTCLVLDPQSAEAQQLVVNQVSEILERYPVDGIHFDDYFFVDGMQDTLPQEEKMQAVNALVQKVYQTVKQKRPDCEFGISPAGNPDYARSQGADIDTWLSQEGYVDYVMPQIYWTDRYVTDGKEVPMFSNRCEVWQTLHTNPEIKLYAGLALYRVGETSDTDLDWALREDNLATQCVHIYGMGYDGFALFRYAYLKENGTQVELQNLYSYLKKQAGILTSEVDAGIVYTVHMQTFGWQEAKMDGIVAGYTKQEKSVEAVRIQLGAYVPKGNVRYAVETAQGQSAWRKDGEQAGSVGQKEPLLGIRINLTGGISDSYDILYRVYVSAQGWTDWGKNGTYTGGGTIQALQVKLVKKAE